MSTKANIPESLVSDEAITLEGILDPERVVCDVTARSKKHALDLLAEALSSSGGLPRLEILDCLISRERLGSTAIGCAVAIPHARINALTSLQASFIRLTEPVAFDAADGKPVRFLFGLLVPAGDEERHLQLLATISQMLSRETFLETLSVAADADELYEVLISFDPNETSDNAPDRR
jgi:PTS system nitrogen regulatory IIA component